MRSDRGVIAQQMSEGAVLAPVAGRVLTVPVSEGRVVLPGETIATLAEDRYILRLQLPERHAQFMRAGDKVLIGSRGLGDGPDEKRREGRVRIVYPEIQGGRVIADVDVDRARRLFRRRAHARLRQHGRAPRHRHSGSYVFRRAGVNYVKTADGVEVVVQPGEPRDDGVEILSGLADGDVLVAP